MKRKIAVVLILVLLLMLTACQQAPESPGIQIVAKNGEELFVVYHYDEQTITVGKTLATVYGPDGELIWEEDRYSYEYDDGDIMIHYPNGATWWENTTDTGAISGWDGDYDPDRYIDGAVLAQQLNQAYRDVGKDWDDVVLIGILCLVIIIVGIFMIKDPETVIRMKYGLRFYHVEPTEFALSEVRFGGVIAIVGSVILFLVALLK